MELHFILDAFREEKLGVSKKADAGLCIVVLKDASLLKARDVTQLLECLPSTQETLGSTPRIEDIESDDGIYV